MSERSYLRALALLSVSVLEITMIILHSKIKKRLVLKWTKSHVKSRNFLVQWPNPSFLYKNRVFIEL